ncbi:MAG: helix-turn-helix domain-containing protein [Armatimonadota bacterium]
MARLAAGLAQQEVADALRCRADQVRRWERGDTYPSPRLLLKLMIAYNIGPQDLIR